MYTREMSIWWCKISGKCRCSDDVRHPGNERKYYERPGNVDLMQYFSIR